MAPAAETLSLAGQWRFRLDEKNQGIPQQWYAGVLPPASAGRGQIALPGTTDEAKAGRPNTEKPTLAGPYRTNVYTGPAWYQRQVEIPAGWQGQRVTLLLERVRWTSRVWLDGRPIGDAQDSLIAPHVYDLGRGLAPGKHTLTIRVDNTVKLQLGIFVSALFGGTPTDMNGIVGRIELRATEPVAIDDVQIYPDVEHKLARVRVHISNATGKAGRGVIVAKVSERGASSAVAERRVEASWDENGGQAKIELPLGEQVKPWDEFSPATLRSRPQLAVADGRPVGCPLLACPAVRTTRSDRPTVAPGANGRFRHAAVRHPRHAVYDQRPAGVSARHVGVRGLPADRLSADGRAAWQRIYRIIKSYGLNFMRFHSWCPPEAAFAAADQEGDDVPGGRAAGQRRRPAPTRPRDAFIEAELQRMVRTYGNHPSFCLMTLGNEYGGNDELLSHWVDMLMQEDPRHLYSSASCGPDHRQPPVHRGRAARHPRAGHRCDFRDVVAKQDRPLIGHEIGQWTFYPNFDEMQKYTGVLAAEEFRAGPRRPGGQAHARPGPAVLPGHGQAGRAALQGGDRGAACGRRAMPASRCWTCTTIPAQGTALVGPLDPFWDSKGFVAPEAHRQYCGADRAAAADAEAHLHDATKRSRPTVEVAHFGPHDLPRRPAGVDASATPRAARWPSGSAAGGRRADRAS